MVPHSICRMLFSSEHHDDATAPADADVDARTWRLPLAEAIEMDGPAGPDADGASVASTSPALSSPPAPVPHLLQPTPLPAALTLDSAKRRTVSAPASPPPPAARALSSVDARAEGSTPSTDPSHAPLSVPTPARSHSPTTASSPTAAATTLPRRPSSAEASKKRSLASAEPTAPRWKRERMPACDIAVAGLVTLVHCPYRFATVYPLSYSSQSPSLASHGFANSSEDPTSPVAWANADSRTTTPRTAPSHDRTPIMVWQIADDTLEACGAGGAAAAAAAESSSAAVTATAVA
ncbi:hypothetical protein CAUPRSCDRAFT_12820 [Caulochytrium protostelioides]|uniref:Uncharacterized protein n=1 Tax=Caulochytrium protostelioides TaxID=1555241 RepID=A0A4P9WU04_9FUNG|nr:hypothetical protein CAUPRSCDRAFT_12820 [Caulochytrium protostelioides]